MSKGTENDNPLNPSPAVLIALGSAVIHAEEYLSPKGHLADKVAFETALKSPEVQKWIEEMNKLAFLPVKR